jgi:DNA helicase-2/ATP-dependent DNA helicase PcrA
MSNLKEIFHRSTQIHKKTFKIFGPPGTGKTTRLIKILEKHLRLGVQPWEIVYVSFTNKAIDEAVDRVLKKFKEYKEEDFDNFRTIHSFCKKHLSNIQVLDPRTDMLQFHTAWGTISANFTEDDANQKVFNNWSLRIYDKARNMLIDPIALYKHEPMKKVRLNQFVDITRNYNSFKKNMGKMDFTDMIDKYLKDVEPVAYKVFIVDEAQDLTPLQWQFVAKVALQAKRIYLAGDDDQAIYEWNGAKVKSFLDFPGRIFILNKSYRLNDTILNFSKEILKFIPERQHKEFISVNQETGSIVTYNRFNEIPFESLVGSWFILGRVSDNVEELKEMARAKGLFFQDMKGNKSFNINKWNALNYWLKLLKGDTLIREEVGILYDYITEIKKGWRKVDNKAWSNVHPNQPLDLQYLKDHCGLQTEETEWWKVLNRKFTTRDLDYFEIMLKRNIQFNENAKIIIDTIHSVKGGEAENVLLYEKANWPSNFSSKNGQDKMAEARVWYTGVTRAKKSLHILSTSHTYFFPLVRLASNFNRKDINDT